MIIEFDVCWKEVLDLRVGTLGQNHAELQWFLSRASEIVPKIYLEIGAREGLLLYMTTRMILPLGSRSLGVDLPGRAWDGSSLPEKKNTYLDLHKVCAVLNTHGYKTDYLLGDSQVTQTVSEVKRWLKDDLVDVLFIDADHTYAGVKRDYECYSPFVKRGGIIAFHDISQASEGKKLDVFRFWREIKTDRAFESMVVEPKKRGIGFIRV